jgi:integrase/recombinase XerD
MVEGRRNYLSQEQFDKLIEHIPDLNSRKWTNEEIEFLFKLSYWCGLRISEAVQVRKEDVNLTERDILLKKVKGGKNELVKIPPIFISELRQFLEKRDDDFLFFGCNRAIVHYWLKKLGTSLGISALVTPQSITKEKTKTHIFRKTIAKDFFEGKFGKPALITLVQKKLRHKDTMTTWKYLNVDEAVLDEYEKTYLT